ncbi:MAG: hypothetical protein QF904_07640 [Gemmatimonadota bacterium]|nr:hypothetical protein [Gemmatimonadota bacterium]MDP7032155.1 hypothetical protein [Gemmatimonadota bacterium]
MPGNIVRALVDPGRACIRAHRAHHSPARSWVMLTAVLAGLGWLSVSVAARVVETLAEAGLSSADAERLAASVGGLYREAMVFAPLAKITDGVIAGGLLAGAARTLGHRIRMIDAQRVVALAAAPEAIGALADLVSVWSAGPEFAPDLTPLRTPSTSLAALLPPDLGLPVPTGVGHRLTLAAGWTLLLRIAGMRALTGAAPGRAAAVTLPGWILGLFRPGWWPG